MSVIDYANGSDVTTPIVLTDDSTQLDLASGTAIQAGVISESGGSFGLEVNDPGAKLILTGDNSYTGTTTVTGVLEVGNGSTTGSVAGDIVDNVNLVFNRSDNYTYSGNISGAGEVAQYGAGILTLAGTNTYSGPTYATNGEIAISSDSNLGTGVIILIGGAIQYTASITSNKNYELYSGSFDTDGNTVTLAGVVSTAAGVNVAAGAGGLTEIGAGTLILTGTDSYGGPTVISTGTLQIGNGGTSGSLGTGKVTDNDTLVFDRSDNVTLGAANAISGTGDVVQDAGSVLTFTTVELYTGYTGIEEGTLALSGQGSIAASQGLDDEGVFDISQTSSGASLTALVGTGIVAVGSKTLTITGGDYVFAGTIQDGGIAGGTGGGLTISGGLLGLTGANTYTGTTTIGSGGVLAVGNNTATGSLGSGAIIDNGELIYDLTIATTLGKTISGSGELAQEGSGTLTITAAQSYTGHTYISAGATLALSATGSIASSSYVYDFGIFDISQTSGATITALAGSGTVDLGGETLTLTAANNYIFSGVIQDGGIAGGSGGGLTINGDSLALTGANTYTGTTTIASGAELVIGNDTATGSLGSGAVVDNGTLIYYLTAPATVGNVISGTGGFAQVGTGTVTLSGIDTYSGATVVADGTLAVTGSIADSAATVLSGATLTGSGTLGTTNVQSGGTLTPGAGIDTLNIAGNLSLASGADYDEYLTPGSGDETLVSGTASIGGTLAVDFSSGSFSPLTTYTILNSTGALTGTFSNIVTNGLPAGMQVNVTYDAHDVFLSVSPAAATDQPPVVTTANISPRPDQTLALSSLFSVSDPDGNVITEYQLWQDTTDPNAGHFVINGVAQPDDTAITVSAAQLAQTSFVTGTVAATLEIRASDGTDWSAAYNASWAPFTVTPVNPPPVVTTANISVHGIQTFALSSLFSVSDPDGNAITEYQLWQDTTDPNAGHFVINGVVQPDDTAITVSAAQLAQTSFVTGTVAATLEIRASDGYAWSAGNDASWSPFTVTPVDQPPVVTTANISPRPDQTLALSSLFTASDPDGDAITAYQLWQDTTDPNAGHFVINGVAQPVDTAITVSAAQLAQTSFVTGTVAATLEIRASDGTDWSAAYNASWAPFTVTPANPPPVVTTTNISVHGIQTLALSSLFSVSDPDGSAITAYQLWQDTTDPNAGHFVINGVAQPDDTAINVSAAQLAQTSFVTGTVAATLEIRASDGYAWSAGNDASWAPFTVTPVDQPPVVTTANITAQDNQTLALSSLFTASDPDGDAITAYQLWQDTTDPNAGHFVINGVAQPVDTAINVSAAQLAQTSFVTGTVAAQLEIRASDGTDWSAAYDASWAPFTVTPVYQPPVVTTANLTEAANQTLALSSLFTVSDPEGNAITAYQVWEDNTDPNAGRFAINGVAQPADTAIDVSAAQLSQTSFVTGTIGATLEIRASDGVAWSQPYNASWSPFHIAIG